ncbi:hypothetical protein HY522_10060 [bacterium]|nr:hypothetical protein [bacterium]
MGNLARIEQEIQKLSSSEVSKLRDWFIERDSRDWDAQIERDAGSGKLDELIEESKEDYRAGRSKEL